MLLVTTKIIIDDDDLVYVRRDKRTSASSAKKRAYRELKALGRKPDCRIADFKIMWSRYRFPPKYALVDAYLVQAPRGMIPLS